jgi:hypothetical protein
VVTFVLSSSTMNLLLLMFFTLFFYLGQLGVIPLPAPLLVHLFFLVGTVILSCFRYGEFRKSERSLLRSVLGNDCQNDLFATFFKGKIPFILIFDLALFPPPRA